MILEGIPTVPDSVLRLLVLCREMELNGELRNPAAVRRVLLRDYEVKPPTMEAKSDA